LSIWLLLSGLIPQNPAFSQQFPFSFCLLLYSYCPEEGPWKNFLGEGKNQNEK
jgi:hypothetical protein